MIKFCLLFFLIIISLSSNSQTSEASVKFRGGMMGHTGYIFNKRPDYTISGACYGIGGQMSYALTKHFRIGTEGYASTFNYHKQDGYYKLGWGGLLAGFQLGSKKLHPVFTLTLGGGKVKDLYVVEGNTSDWEIDRVVYRKYPTMLFAPAFNLEYSLKSKLTLILKLDYLIPVFSSYYNDYAYGPRLYLGILFNRG